MGACIDIKTRRPFGTVDLTEKKPKSVKQKAVKPCADCWRYKRQVLYTIAAAKITQILLDLPIDEE